MTHRIFGRDEDLPPVRELARKTRAIMKPVSPKKGNNMDTNNNTSKPREIAELATVVVIVAGVTTLSVFAANKIAGKISDGIIDAVVNTMTLARKRKPVPVVHNVTNVA